MKMIALTSLLLLLAACKKSNNETTAIKAIASTANDTLIEELLRLSKLQGAGKELSLAEVLAQKDKYGLSDKEVELIRRNFEEKDLGKLVLQYLDANGYRGKVAPQWVYVPQVSDSSIELKKLSSFDKDGEITIIDGSQPVQDTKFPVITLSLSEKSLGAQKAILPRSVSSDADGSLMLNTLSFRDLREPWIKGSAEIYASITYVGKDGKGVSELVELPSIDQANLSYDLRQIVHMWKSNKYQIANIVFFEHDSKQDYSSLANTFINAASAVVSATVDPSKATTLAVTDIVSDVSSKVIAALPQGSLTDDDDFIDVINTIEKYQPGTRSGAAGNAKAELSFYQVKINDE